MDSNVVAKGVYHCELIRDGKKIDEWTFDNIVTNEGLTSSVSVTLCNYSQITSWYLGIFEGDYTPSATDTAAGFATNATECTAYQESARPSFVPEEPTGPSCTNINNKAVFTFNQNKTIYGAFLISSRTKGGVSGKLMSAAQFSTGPKSVTPTDQLLITYTYNLASV